MEKVVWKDYVKDSAIHSQVTWLKNRTQINYPLHSHVGQSEFMLILKGKQHHELNKHNQFLQEGDLVYIDERDEHALGLIRQDPADCELVNVAFPSGVLNRLIGIQTGSQDLEGKTVRSSLSTTVFKLSGNELSFFSHNIRHLLISPKENPYRLYEMILHILSKNSERLTSWEDEMPVWLSEAIQKMNESESISSKQFYTFCNRSVEHVARVFKKHMRQKPSEWINHKRIERAKNLLIQSNDSNLDVALTCGFKSLAHFHREFIKYENKTPGQYRRSTIRSPYLQS